MTRKPPLIPKYICWTAASLLHTSAMTNNGLTYIAANPETALHHHHHHHHHQITKLSHSINAIGPAPHRSGRKREHCSIVFATITHIPS
jgi:hypothetical protein